MSWTIVDDDDTLHIRAIITNRDELKALVEKLQHKLAGHEGSITSTSDASLHFAGSRPVIIESTADGMANEFNTMWQVTKKEPTDE